jgi:site-specific DNA-methyltransferase (adenine-specific)/adenine-specific DNA-methyltransferase
MPAKNRRAPSTDDLDVELRWPGKRLPVPPVPAPLECVRRYGTHAPEGSWCNKLIWGENLHVLAALLPELVGKVDLIYIDPPFASGRDFSMPAEASDGETERAEKVFGDRWQGGVAGYLQMMYERLALAHRLLAPTGMLYVHLDTRMSASVRLILDELFGARRLFNEIIWHYKSGGRARSCFSFKHDTILAYSRGERPFFDGIAAGSPRGAARRNHMKRGVDPDGRRYSSIRSAGKVYKYYDDEAATPDDVWHDVSHLQQKDPERTGYPTQKPVRLLERIIQSSAPAEGLVLDFFCGSGTTAVAAENLGRRWIACDVGRRAVDVTRRRLGALPECRPFELLHLAGQA